MKPLDLDALQAICDAATPGPWRAGSVETSDPNRVFLVDSLRVVALVDPRSVDMAANARFVAMAREVMPALIAELREARAKLPHHCGSQWCGRRVDPDSVLCDECTAAESMDIYAHEATT